MELLEGQTLRALLESTKVETRILGRRMLGQLAGIATPDTILRRYLLMDRDAKFSEAFRVTLEQSGVEPVRLPPRSPNLSPHIERFMRSLKAQCLGRIIFFGEKALQSAAACFLEHFHAVRNHQGLGNRMIEPGEEVKRTSGEVVCRERLGGLLRYYYRKAA